MTLVRDGQRKSGSRRVCNQAMATAEGVHPAADDREIRRSSQNATWAARGDPCANWRGCSGKQWKALNQIAERGAGSVMHGQNFHFEVHILHPQLQALEKRQTATMKPLGDHVVGLFKKGA